MNRELHEIRETAAEKWRLCDSFTLISWREECFQNGSEHQQTADKYQSKKGFSLYVARTPRGRDDIDDTDRSFAADDRPCEDESTADAVYVEFASNKHRFTLLPGGQ